MCAGSTTRHVRPAHRTSHHGHAASGAHSRGMFVASLGGQVARTKLRICLRAVRIGRCWTVHGKTANVSPHYEQMKR
eukprot:1430116-Rhodomonas_salina.1